MVKRVRLPDGRIAEVPDDITQEELLSLAASQPNQPRMLPIDLTPEERDVIFDPNASEEQKRLAIATAAGRAAGQEGSAGEAFLRDFVPFGVGTLAGAAGTFLGQQLRALAPGDQTGLAQEGGFIQRFKEALAAERGRTEGLRQRSPGASLAGAVTGAVATAPVALAGLARASAAVPALGRAAGALALREGQSLINLGRLAATGAAGGAIEGGARGALETGDAATGAALGAAGGAVLGPVAAGAVSAGVGLGRRITDAFRAAGGEQSRVQSFRLLARRLLPRGAKVSEVKNLADELENASTRFRQLTGRPPRVAELLNEVQVKDIAQIGETQPVIGNIFQRAAEQTALERQTSLAKAIRNRRQRISLPQLEQGRKVEADELFGQIADREVSITPTLKKVLLSPEVKQAVRSRSLLRFISQAASKGTPIPVGALDAVRQALREKAGTGTGDLRVFSALQEDLVDEAAAQVPEFRDAIRRFELASQRIEGFQQGFRDILSRQPESDLPTRLLLAPQREVRGIREGARERLVSEAGESPAGAVTTARRLAESRGLGQRLERVFSRNEAARLRNLGELESTSARNLAELSRSVTPETRAQLDEQLGKDVVDILFAQRAGGAFRASLAARFARRLAIPRSSAIDIAEALTDPSRTAGAIARLREAGVSLENLQRLIRQAALTAGILFGRAAGAR